MRAAAGGGRETGGGGEEGAAPQEPLVMGPSGPVSLRKQADIGKATVRIEAVYEVDEEGRSL